jgi:hypothetical protein
MTTNWGPWVLWGDPFRTTPGAPVTAVPLKSGQFALFATNTSGGIFTSLRDPQRGFGRWTSVSEGSTTPGAPITAVPWGEQLAVFIADPNGGVYTTGGAPGSPFGGWAIVGDPFRTTPGAAVTAVPWKSGQFALFATNTSGGIFTSLGDPQRGFGRWTSVSEGSTTPGAPITAVPWGEQLGRVYRRSQRGGLHHWRSSWVPLWGMGYCGGPLSNHARRGGYCRVADRFVRPVCYRQRRRDLHDFRRPSTRLQALVPGNGSPEGRPPWLASYQNGGVSVCHEY